MGQSLYAGWWEGGGRGLLTGRSKGREERGKAPDREGTHKWFRLSGLGRFDSARAPISRSIYCNIEVMVDNAALHCSYLGSLHRQLVFVQWDIRTEMTHQRWLGTL